MSFQIIYLLLQLEGIGPIVVSLTKGDVFCIQPTFEICKFILSLAVMVLFQENDGKIAVLVGLVAGE